MSLLQIRLEEIPTTQFEGKLCPIIKCKSLKNIIRRRRRTPIQRNTTLTI
jgi:hypothetical protein